MLLLLAVGVGKVKVVQAKLVGHDDHPVVRHPAGNPVVAADGLQPPDLLTVREGHAVGLIGAVLLQQGTGAQHALPGGADVGEHQRHQVLFANPAGDLFGVAVFLLLIPDIGVRADDPGVAGDGLRGSHGHVGLVDAAGGPHAVSLCHVGAVGIAQCVPRQLHGQVRDDCFIGGSFLPGRMGHKALGFKPAVVVAGDDCGAVVTGSLADQNGCAGHIWVLLSFFRLFYTM